LRRAMVHKSLNCFTQGSGADLLKVAMVNIWESGLLDKPEEFMLSLAVHDEFDGSIGRSPIALEKFREVKHLMDTALEIEVPILTEAKTGTDWSQTH